MQYIRNIASDVPTLLLHGEIGINPETGQGIDGAAFAKELYYLQDQLGVKKCIVSINSVGGSVIDGYSIFSAIKDTKMVVNTRIDGLAASIAGIIALAGKKVSIQDYGMLMVHNPSGGGVSAKDMEITNSFRNSLITMISARTGLSSNEVSKMMDYETWMDATTALEKKFVDEIVSNVKKPVLSTENPIKALEIANKFIQEEKKDEFKQDAHIFIHIDKLVERLELSNYKNIEVVKTEIQKNVENVIKNALATPTRKSIPVKIDNKNKMKVKTKDEYLNMSPEEAIGELLEMITKMMEKEGEMEDKIKNKDEKLATLEAEKAELAKSQAEILVENAIAQGKIKIKNGADSDVVKASWVNLAITNPKAVSDVLAQTPNSEKAVDVSNYMKETSMSNLVDNPAGLSNEELQWTHRQWEQNNPNKLMQIKNQYPEYYQKLFNAEYKK